MSPTSTEAWPDAAIIGYSCPMRVRRQIRTGLRAKRIRVGRPRCLVQALLFTWILGIGVQACGSGEDATSAGGREFEESTATSGTPSELDSPVTEPVKMMPVGRVQGIKVVMLGSGGPPPDPERSGPAVALLSQERAYLVDFGPGLVRRAVAAQIKGWLTLHPRQLTRAFVTHLHSDHTAGFADLMLTPPAVGRTEALHVYGPPGIGAMTQHLVAAYAEDLSARHKGLEEKETEGYRVEAHEIQPGLIYEDEVMRVTAFAQPHGDWKYAFGYRFDAGGRSVVVSGDATASDAVVEACQGCDVLVHEVYCEADFKAVPRAGRSYFRAAHTSTKELAKLATRAQPGLLVLYHLLLRSCSADDLLQEMQRYEYSGEVVVGEDLAAY
jgi:ribonuclease BN (tRNA processing enzyme)